MRKVAVGLAIIALLAFAAESSARSNGTADPLGLISSAVIQPFWTAGDSFTLIELTSPVWYNLTMHGFWFNNTCTRGQSFPVPLTRNDIEVFDVEFQGAPVNQNGLVVLARSDDFVTLDPLQSPIHSRGHWISVSGDFIRTVDPIAVTSAETLDGLGRQQHYSPLRSAASFSNPQHLAGIALTTIYLVCPTSTVYGTLPVTRGFPTPPATTSGVIAVVFNNEEPEVDVEIPCSCLTERVVSSIDPIYTTEPDQAEDSVIPVWYTELYAYDPGFLRKKVLSEDNAAEEAALIDSEGPVKAFTGYRAIVWANTPFGAPATTVDDFGRLSNASAGAYLYGVLGGR